MAVQILKILLLGHFFKCFVWNVSYASILAAKRQKSMDMSLIGWSHQGSLIVENITRPRHKYSSWLAEKLRNLPTPRPRLPKSNQKADKNVRLCLLPLLTAISRQRWDSRVIILLRTKSTMGLHFKDMIVPSYKMWRVVTYMVSFDKAALFL